VFAEVDATIRIGFPCLYTGMGSATSFVGKWHTVATLVGVWP
jgi:hypothetical protein